MGLKTLLILISAFFLAPRLKKTTLLKLVFSSIALGLFVDVFVDTLMYYAFN